MQTRSENGWRSASDLVITPDVRGVEWDGFTSGPDLVKAGQAAAEAALPEIERWLAGFGSSRIAPGLPALTSSSPTPDSTPA
jgi:hypothetical protein